MKPQRIMRCLKICSGVEMKIYFPAEQGIPQMTGVPGEYICPGIPAHQPAEKQIDRQGEAVHLHKENDGDRGESAEGAPIAARLWLRVEAR